MNLGWYFTRRLAFSRQNSFSKLIIRVAITAVALSIAVMILAGAIVAGFQKEVSSKVFGFWGHVVIQNLEQGSSYEEVPVSASPSFYPVLKSLEGIRHIQVVATKAGIIKTDTEIEGIVLKGIGDDFDWNFMQQYITSGDTFHATGDSSSRRKIIISQTTADRLHLKLGDKLMVNVLPDINRKRTFHVAGIYKTGLEEYDRKFALVDIAEIRNLNNWKDDEVGGFEVFLNDVRQLDHFTEVINQLIPEDYAARSLKTINPNLFDWLHLQSVNEKVIMVLMIVIAIINLTTMLLILILERTNMIGTLKAIGGSDQLIGSIFLTHAAFIIIIGLLVGNGVGVGIGILQKQFHFIKLDEASYYVSEAPVLFQPLYILFVNVGTLIVCLVALIIPALLIRRISPVKAIRFK